MKNILIVMLALFAAVPVWAQTAPASTPIGTTAPVQIKDPQFVDANGKSKRPAVDAQGNIKTTTSGTGNIQSAPSVPGLVNLSANVSNTICALTPGAAYEVACGADATYRVAAATPTALSTDTDLPGRTPKTMKLLAGQTCIAFLSSSATTCKASLIPVAP